MAGVGRTVAVTMELLSDFDEGAAMRKAVGVGMVVQLVLVDMNFGGGVIQDSFRGQLFYIKTQATRQDESTLWKSNRIAIDWRQLRIAKLLNM